jgi:hypothetical protein
MCDLAYVNLLREKVRQLEGEEKRALRDVRFKPYVTPVQSQSQNAADRKRPRTSIESPHSIEWNFSA